MMSRRIPRSPASRRHRQRGFMGGMSELVIVMALLLVLMTITGPTVGDAISMLNLAKDEQQDALNKRLGSVLLDYAASATTTGALPAPYSSGNVKAAIYDPTNTKMQDILTEARITPNQANGDAVGKDNVRVYQMVPDLQTNVPLYGGSGPAISLTYQQAVIYSTHCGRNEVCNTTGTGGMPGVSGAYTATNLATFALSGDEFGLTTISSLNLQKLKLARTVETLDAIRTRLQEFFREKQRIAAASDTSNFYPRQVTPVAAASLGTSPDCHNDGWFRLDNSDILLQIGLQPSDSGLNAWGGQIQYCPDYDPLGTSGANQPPHFAALRILQNVSSGLSPTNATSNVTVSF